MYRRTITSHANGVETIANKELITNWRWADRTEHESLVMCKPTYNVQSTLRCEPQTHSTIPNRIPITHVTVLNVKIMVRGRLSSNHMTSDCSLTYEEGWSSGDYPKFDWPTNSRRTAVDKVMLNIENVVSAHIEATNCIVRFCNCIYRRCKPCTFFHHPRSFLSITNYQPARVYVASFGHIGCSMRRIHARVGVFCICSRKTWIRPFEYCPVHTSSNTTMN